MLINALCEYYDELEQAGKIVPEGYSKQGVHYLIALTPDGKIDGISDFRIKSPVTDKKGRTKESLEPRPLIFPQRTEKTGIESNIIEHRPLYIFGLNFEKGVFTPDDKTGKAKKSHAAFVKTNLEFIEGMDSPLINAYRSFMQSWIPENETDNPHLTALGKDYQSSFAFCLSGHTDELLQNEPQITQKLALSFSDETGGDEHKAQCAVMGKEMSIARIHNKIKGVPGGQPSGTVLVGFKTSAGWSYGNEQSYNSNISSDVMKKYTSALNSLLGNKRHRTIIDDTTVIYWAAGGSENDMCCDLFDSFFNPDPGSDKDEHMDKTQTEQMLSDTFSLVSKGGLTRERISTLTGVDDNIEFYVVGLKPNAARIAVKFIYRRRFADILFSAAKHHEDMYISGITRPVPFWRLKKELVPPESKQEIHAALLSALFRSILFDSPYPEYLLSALVTRVKTDRSINSIRAGAIKACINRKSRALNEKEELTVALDIRNTNQAYLCGRLFAVLERIQQQSAAPAKLNRTIKDAYFASAASKPSIVFPKLLSLSQNHLKKLDESSNVYFSKLVGGIISQISGEFPDTLALSDQGRFMIGYYHQIQDFFTKNIKEEN